MRLSCDMQRATEHLFATQEYGNLQVFACRRDEAHTHWYSRRPKSAEAAAPAGGHQVNPPPTWKGRPAVLPRGCY
jgi:hypothetical protein